MGLIGYWLRVVGSGSRGYLPLFATLNPLRAPQPRAREKTGGRKIKKMPMCKCSPLFPWETCKKWLALPTPHYYEYQYVRVLVFSHYKDVFRRAPSRVGRGCRTALDGGVFRVGRIFFVFISSNAHGLLQVRGHLASCSSLLLMVYSSGTLQHQWTKKKRCTGKKLNRSNNTYTAMMMRHHRWSKKKGVSHPPASMYSNSKQ